MDEHHGLFANPRVWVAIAFVIFFVIFGRTIRRALVAILDKRAATVRAELAEAQSLRAEAERLLADARQRRETAMTEAAQLLEGARTEASRAAAAAAEEARAAAARRERMALDRIAAAEKAAVADVRRAAVDIASAAATRVIAEDLNADGDAALVDHAIAGLPVSLSRRAA